MSIKTSFPAIVYPDTTILVLGSLPGDRSLAAQRYYAHPQNQFWKLMSDVIGVDLQSLPYEGRLYALRMAGVGLWDVVGMATRTGSTDAAIRDVRANDLVGLIGTLPKLRAIAFNGGTALNLGRKLLGPLAGTVRIVALPSSSPLHTVGVAAKQAAWNQLKDFIVLNY